MRKGKLIREKGVFGSKIKQSIYLFSPFGKQRWKELFKKDIAERMETLITVANHSEDSQNASLVSVYKEMVSHEDFSWREKYKRVHLAEKEEKQYRKLFIAKPITPKIFGEPLHNPLLHYSKTKQLPSLFNPLNYFLYPLIALFQPVWFWFFTVSLSSNPQEWK